MFCASITIDLDFGLRLITILLLLLLITIIILVQRWSEGQDDRGGRRGDRIRIHNHID
jgi:hypothetical protein